MALTLENKKAIVAEVAEVAANATAAVIADYRGLKVSELTELRANARKNDVYMRVVRNTLARRAVEGTEFQCLTEALTGPTLLAFSKSDPGSAARILKGFVKDHERISVTALAVGGKLLAASQLDAVAKLPTKLEALTILATLLQAPITKFVRTLAEPHAKLVRTVAAIRDQKQAAA